MITNTHDDDVDMTEAGLSTPASTQELDLEKRIAIQKAIDKRSKTILEQAQKIVLNKQNAERTTDPKQHKRFSDAVKSVEGNIIVLRKQNGLAEKTLAGEAPGPMRSAGGNPTAAQMRKRAYDVNRRVTNALRKARKKDLQGESGSVEAESTEDMEEQNKEEVSTPAYFELPERTRR